MKSQRRKQSQRGTGFSLQFTLVTLFSLLLIVTVSIIVGYGYYSDRQVLLGLSDRFIDQVNESVSREVTDYLAPAQQLVELGTAISQNPGFNLFSNDSLQKFSIQAMQPYPQMSAFYFGSRYGSHHMVYRQSNDQFVAKAVRAGKKTPNTTWRVFDSSGNPIREREGQEQYDPRTRPWYAGAVDSSKPFWTDVYIFHTLRKPGITVSRRAFNYKGEYYGVFGVDIELGALSDFLAKQKVGKTGIVLIIDTNNKIVAHPDFSQVLRQKEGRYYSLTTYDLEDPWVVRAIDEYRRTDKQRLAFELDQDRYLASVVPLSPVIGRNWLLVVVANENDFLGQIKSANLKSVFISAGILLLSILLTLKLSRSISRPIVHLAEETQAIKDLHLDDLVEVKSYIWEISYMQDAITSMKQGLKAFKKYVPSALVRQLIQTGQEAHIGGVNRDLSIMFTDIGGFTKISETTPAEALLPHLSEYLEELTAIIRSSNGTVDKYIGDAIMAFWGAPIESERHAFFACQAALLCRDRLKRLNARWEAAGKHPFPTRFGIHCGDTVVGNIGSQERMNYTVLGDSVNLASRLEGVNTLYGTTIIVSQAVYERVKEDYVFRPLDVVSVKGKAKSTKIYELVCDLTDPKADHNQQMAAQFDLAFEAYQAQKWDVAIAAFKTFESKYPEVPNIGLYVDRCSAFKKSSPGDDWDGVYRLETKKKGKSA